MSPTLILGYLMSFFLSWGSPIPMPHLLQLVCTHHYSAPFHAFVPCRLWALNWNFDVTSPVYTGVMLLLLRVSDREFGVALLQFFKKMCEHTACSEGSCQGFELCSCPALLKMTPSWGKLLTFYGSCGELLWE